MIHLGLDPGYSGGLAVIGPHGVTVKPWPAFESDVWASIAFPTDYWKTSDGGVVAVIEEVHSMPHDGVHSAFKFGRHYGTLRGMLVAAGIPFVAVSPQQWQAEFAMAKHGGEKPHAYKSRLRAKAQSLFPGVKVTKETADALLLAEYCRRHAARLFPPIRPRPK